MNSDRVMKHLAEFAKPLAPVHASTTGAEVYSRFQSDANILAIAVVDDDHRPIGVLERNAFFLKMGAQHGRALFGGRPVTFVMESPQIQTQDAQVMDFMGGALMHDPASLLKGFIIIDADGRYVAVGTALSLLEAGYVAANAKVQKLAELSAELALAEQEARAASRAKSNFLATMSHEIRTPLNGVLAVAEIIDVKLTQEDLRPYIRTILQSGRTLHSLLSDALDLSRGEAGAATLTPEPLAIGPLMVEIDALWRSLAEQRGLGLKVTTSGDVDLLVMADGIRLRQVLNNLIGNALKFTHVGEVDVQVRMRRDEATVHLEIAVTDSGQGIDAQHLEHIFEPFAKADEHQGGAGLGLSICRQIVEAMGGRIDAASTLGEGSTFTVHLALSEAGALAATASQAADEAVAEYGGEGGAHVLIVDDNETNRLVASTFVEMAGFSWTSAVNGREAVERAGCEVFDLILMDIKMPVMDGIAATRAIRGGTGPNRNIPILAVTANTDPHDAVSYLDAGMSGVVGKPLNSEALFAAINRLETAESTVKAA